MRLHWVGPLPPCASPAAARLREVLPRLAARATVDLWVAEGAAWEPELEAHGRVLRYGDAPPAHALNQGDAVVFHVDGAPATEAALRAATRHAGIVVLHPPVAGLEPRRPALPRALAVLTSGVDRARLDALELADVPVGALSPEPDAWVDDLLAVVEAMPRLLARRAALDLAARASGAVTALGLAGPALERVSRSAGAAIHALCGP